MRNLSLVRLSDYPKQGNGGPQASDRNRRPEASPPLCNTGVLLAKEESSRSFGIDHLAFTVNVHSVEEVTQKLGGEWEKIGSGFRGYPESFIYRCGEAYAQLGAGKPQAPGEVHVQLAGGYSRGISFEALQELRCWIQKEKNGHFTRIDAAFDDRTGTVTVEKVREAVDAGQLVTRARKGRNISGVDLATGVKEGGTFEVGSRRSESFTRIYDKAAEQRSKGVTVDGPWTRVEVELKGERADRFGLNLMLEFEQFRELAIGVLRSVIDFRQVNREDEDWIRSRSPVVAWWGEFTEGLKICRLSVVRAAKYIEQVWEWADHSLAPMLSVLVASGPEAQSRLLQIISNGVSRWKDSHRQLVREAWAVG